MHEQFFNYIKENVTFLSRVSIPLVTDREVGISNAIANILPNVKIVHCCMESFEKGYTYGFGLKKNICKRGGNWCLCK